MKSKPALSIIFTAAIAWATMPTHAEEGVLFFDSFESGNMSTTNATGFQWEHVNRTSIVTQSETDGNVIIYSPLGEEVYDIQNDGRDWTAFDGENSLRFRYPAGVNWSEQRFDLGEAYPELWISYWIRVPTNFSYGTTGRSNNKFFAIWMDEYEFSGDGSTVFLGMEPYNTTGATLGFTYTNGHNTGGEAYKQHTPFITTADRGRWMQIVLHIKAETSEDSNDGIVETFRRWENEDNFTKLHETFSAPIRIPTDGPKGFKSGYILGWANRTYDSDTEWLLDNFTISDSFTISNSPAPPSSPIVTVH